MKHLAAAFVMSLPICASAQDAFVEYKSLVPDLALRVAQTALQSCQYSGYQVGVTVVDRFGQPQVYLRDRYAGMHVFETSHRKAWTAVSFRTDTGDLAQATQAGEVASAIRHISQALPLAGGLVIYSGDGSIVGGVGVSGAPGPELDAVCAQAGIDAIEEDIAF
jgi:uncharacterized protein GlcG (DUF336 family)